MTLNNLLLGPCHGRHVSIQLLQHCSLLIPCGTKCSNTQAAFQNVENENFESMKENSPSSRAQWPALALCCCTVMFGRACKNTFRLYGRCCRSAQPGQAPLTRHKAYMHMPHGCVAVQGVSWHKDSPTHNKNISSQLLDSSSAVYKLWRCKMALGSSTSGLSPSCIPQHT